MEIIYIISAIISLIMLIQYFVLCGNVKGIKDILESPATATNVHLSEYKKHKFIMHSYDYRVFLVNKFIYMLAK